MEHTAPASELERRKQVRIRLRGDLNIEPQKYEGRTFPSSLPGTGRTRARERKRPNEPLPRSTTSIRASSAGFVTCRR
jgi:hypothetical protein